MTISDRYFNLRSDSIDKNALNPVDQPNTLLLQSDREF